MFRIDLSGVDRQLPSVDDIIRYFGITNREAQNALWHDYATYYRFLGPFVTAIAADMLPDLRLDVATGPANTKIAFVGRDGHPFAAAVRALDPDFFAAHCTEVVASRVTAIAALKDAEREGPLSSGDEPFRTSPFMEVEAFPGSHERFTRYLADRGLPVLDASGGRVVLVDDAYGNGTLQKTVSLLYAPRIEVMGRYMLVTPVSPSQRSDIKRGYVVHKEDPVVYPLGYPTEPGMYLASWGAQVFERLLSGPLGTVTGYDANGPQQVLESPFSSDVPVNPSLVPETHRDSTVFTAGKTVGLLAVHDYARDHPPGPGGNRHIDVIRRGQDEFTQAVGYWAFGHGTPGDPALTRLMDAYVPHAAERADVETLYSALHAAGIDPTDAMPLWKRLASAHRLGLRDLDVAPERPEEFRFRRTGVSRLPALTSPRHGTESLPLAASSKYVWKPRTVLPPATGRTPGAEPARPRSRSEHLPGGEPLPPQLPVPRTGDTGRDAPPPDLRGRHGHEPEAMPPTADDASGGSPSGPLAPDRSQTGGTPPGRWKTAARQRTRGLGLEL